MVANPPALTDSDLLHRYARQQDEGAFAQLVHRHQAMVLGVAGRRTGDADLARDIAQHVFVLLARKASQLLRHDRLAGWLYQTASFEAAKLQQSENRRRSRQSEYAALPPADHHICHEQWQALEEAMIALSEPERDVLVLHYFQDRSYAEMAAASALSEAAMRKRVSRALEQLSRHLQHRSHPLPAAALLTTAVAMQSTVPTSAALSATALTLSTTAPAAGWMSLAALMTTNTVLKTTATIALIAAIPLAWQTTINASLRAEIARETQQRPLITPTPAAAAAASSPASSGTVMDADAAQARLADLRSQRATEERRLASLKAQSAKLRNEIVVSLGRVDEVALKIAELQLLGMELEHLDGRQAEQEKLLSKVMTLTSEMMPIIAEFRRISADPKLSARMAATSTAKVAGIDEAARAEMERRLLGHYERMKTNGLTLDHRPEKNRSDWDRRYGEASAAAMRDIESLVPAAMRESSLWKSQISPQAEGHLNFLDAIFGG